MKLKVKNLGPIKQGEIDLSKRFSVFVGYNNSGKTYMSQVIWSLLDFWENKANLDNSFVSRSEFILKSNIFDMYLEALKNPSDTVLLRVEDIKTIFEHYYSEIKEKIISDFNLNSKISSFENMEISFENDFNTFKNRSLTIDDYPYYTFKKQAGSLEIQLDGMQHSDEDSEIDSNDLDVHFEPIEPEEEKFERSHFLYHFIVHTFAFEQKRGDKFFLPADRSFYASYYKYIYASIKEDFERQRKNKNKKITVESNYTESVNDLLSSVYDLNLKTPKETGLYNDLIDELQKVIGGDIVTRSSNPDISSLATFKLKMQNQEELDMHLSSSSVNQLTTLYLYLKYWAKERGNTLIIDEPEENLHPRNQLALLNVLMKFANRNNNRVVVTTHSPLMTDAVNNHLHLGYLAEKYNKDIAALIRENDLDLDAEAALSHKDIGIYFFDGQSIKEYDVEEYGADFKDFRKEQEKVEETGDTLRGLILKEKKNQLQERHQNGIAHV